MLGGKDQKTPEGKYNPPSRDHRKKKTTLTARSLGTFKVLAVSSKKDPSKRCTDPPGTTDFG